MRTSLPLPFPLDIHDFGYPERRGKKKRKIRMATAFLLLSTIFLSPLLFLTRIAAAILLPVIIIGGYVSGFVRFVLFSPFALVARLEVRSNGPAK